MKKVLIITYYWPPAGGAGVQRWLKFVKYLREHGWEPVVYTALNGEMPVIDKSLEKDVPQGVTVLKTPIWEPYSVYKRFIGRKKDDRINASFLNEGRKTGLAEKISIWIRGNFFIPDARKFWIRPSIRFLTAHLKKNRVDAVISSGPPHSMHLIALGLKKEFPSLKWVADFRDPWTHIDFYGKLMLSKAADRKHHRLERTVLEKADIVLSIGAGMCEEFKEIYSAAGGKDTKKFRIITNGYDEADVSGTAEKPDEKFSLAHIGTLVKDRNPAVLWEVLSALVKENREFSERLEIKLVGKVDIAVKEDLRSKGLESYVRYVDYLPHDEVMKEQKRSALLLLLVNDTPNAKGILTGKFFEYLASGRPVLAIGPTDGDLADILRETCAGSIAGFSDRSGMREGILGYFKGEMPKRNEDAIKRYGRKHLTGQLAHILNE